MFAIDFKNVYDKYVYTNPPRPYSCDFAYKKLRHQRFV